MNDSHLVGCSYYVNPWSDITNEWSPGVRYQDKYYAWQMPQSWGAMYAGRFWDKFLSFEKETREPGDTPFAFSNRWPYEASWKRILLRMMYTEGTSLLYPPLNLGGVSIPTSLSHHVGNNSKGGHYLSGRLMANPAPPIQDYQQAKTKKASR